MNSGWFLDYIIKLFKWDSFIEIHYFSLQEVQIS